MKKLTFFFAISCLLVLNSFAQTRERRVFDNFDTRSGVQIFVPPSPQSAPVAVAPKNTPKKLIKKTAQQTRVGSVQDGLGLQNVSQPQTRQSSPNKLTMSAGNSLGGFTTGDTLIDSYIVESSIRYNVDPLLIYAQMHQESSFKRKAISYKGASGLMQLMPATARRFGVTSIFDPKQNIDAGVKYMRWLLNTFNQDLRLALAGYNAGEGAVMKYGWQIPPYNETQEYVRRITARYNSIKNPNYIARTVKKVSATEAAKFEQKESAPLTIYEPEPLTIRLPDGRMRLVSQ
ncbi:MAG: lytic transglycosylase domain-containing protein [Acidobacteriota bacterium]|nr:lytic transglycosylase domain-containing protein [Acidobacteriota bacterium]